MDTTESAQYQATLNNNGPRVADDSHVSFYARKSSGQPNVVLHWVAEQGDFCFFELSPVDCDSPIGLIDEIHVSVDLPLNTDVVVSRSLQYRCYGRIAGAFDIEATIHVIPPSTPVTLTDPQPTNNDQTFVFANDCHY